MHGTAGVPETGAMRILGSYDLFPPHCIMSTCTCKQHVAAVNDEHGEAILSLDKRMTKRLLKVMAISMESIATKQDATPQRVDVTSTSECVPQE